MTYREFVDLPSRVAALSPDLKQRPQSGPEGEIAAAAKPPAGTGLGSLGAMHDDADELDEAVEHAMNPRQRPWRLPDGG
jgi:hypothetical protein